MFSSLVHEFDDKTVFGFLIFFEKVRVSDVWSYTKLIVKYTQYTLHYQPLFSFERRMKRLHRLLAQVERQFDDDAAFY